MTISIYLLPSECSGQTCCRNRNRNARSHHSSPPEPTLASDQVPYCLQALCAHAPGVSWGRSAAYLSDMMTSVVADMSGRERLRSSSSFRYELPRLKLKFRERSFLFSGPKVWNSLPSNLQELTHTDTVKKVLKTHLFKLAFRELK